MVKRRQFMSGLAALGGSYLLSACGGGSEDGSNGTAVSAASKATAHASAASASGTTIPPAASITDSSGAVWTLSGGVLYQNGAVAGVNYNVVLALWINGSIYHENASGQFYQWNGSAWGSCIDPRLGTVSADGTTLPSAPYILDKSGAKWTLVNGVVYKNGTVVGVNYNVSLVLWYGGKIYHCNTSGHFYANAEVSSQWLACTDPRIAVAPAAGSFFGINGHYDYTYTPAQLVTTLKAMGCTSYRVGCTSDPTQINAVAKLAQAFQSAGIKLLVLINQGLYDSTGKLFSGESTAYSAGYSAGSAVAGALMGYGVTMYECGNELTRDGAIILDSTNAGTKALDFNNANWPVLREVRHQLLCERRWRVRRIVGGYSAGRKQRLSGGALGYHDLAQLRSLRRYLQHRHRRRGPRLRSADVLQSPLRRAFHHLRVEYGPGANRGLSGKLHHHATGPVLSGEKDSQHPVCDVLRAR
jgi:hypothetical protein